MNKHVRGLLATLIAGSIIGLVSCSTSEAGSPSPSSSTAIGTTTGDAESRTNPFANIDSCDLLNHAMQGKDFPAGEPDNYGSDNGCQTNNPDIASYSLDLITDASLSDWANENIAHRGSIEGRTAVRQPQGDDGCAVAMKVSSQAIASVGVTADPDTDEACNMVTEIAKKVEPMLPGGE